MGKTQKLRDKNGDGIKEIDFKTVKKNKGLEKQTKMPPFSKKERI